MQLIARRRDRAIAEERRIAGEPVGHTRAFILRVEDAVRGAQGHILHPGNTVGKAHTRRNVVAVRVNQAARVQRVAGKDQLAVLRAARIQNEVRLPVLCLNERRGVLIAHTIVQRQRGRQLKLIRRVDAVCNAALLVLRNRAGLQGVCITQKEIGQRVAGVAAA